MEECARFEFNEDTRTVPTDPELIKGIGVFLSCCDHKKCCKKYKKGKRCKKCPGRKD